MSESEQIKWEDVKKIYPVLTQRKCEILAGTFSGLSEEELSEKLCITEGCIRSHKSTILKMLRIKDKNRLRNDFDAKKNKNERFISKEKFDNFVNSIKINFRKLYGSEESNSKKPR